MTVVSNTSPIVNLAAIGKIELLRELYGTLIIPQAVFDEIVVDAGMVRALNWIVTNHVSDRSLVNSLKARMHPGEAEAVALALELRADLLLLDERVARAAARDLGLTFTGVIGALLEAKARTLLSSVQPTLDQLIGAGFWIDKDLYDLTLVLAGEREAAR